VTEENYNRITDRLADEAIRDVKRMLFVAVGNVVMLGRHCVGRMKSHTYAVRTANALNLYEPNERGR